MPEITKLTTGSKVAFGDVVQLSKERSKDPEADGFERYVGLEHLEQSDLKIRSWGDLADGVSFTNVFRPGQVLFGKRRAYQRKVAVADFSGVCSGDIYVLEPKCEHLAPDLLPFICQSEPFYDYVISMSQGGLSPRVNWTALAKYEFDLPSLEEQRRIVNILQAFERLIEDTQKVMTSLQLVERSIISKVITTAGPRRMKIKEFAKFKSGDGITISKLPKEPDSEHPIPVIGGNGIAAYSSQPLPDIPNPVIVIGRVGEYCGSVHYVKQSCWISDNALFVCSLDDYIQSRYFAACLQGLNLNRFSVGGAQPLVNQRIIGELEIPIPAVERQEQIIRKLQKVEKTLNSLELRLSHTKRLKKEVLQKVLEKTP